MTSRGHVHDFLPEYYRTDTEKIALYRRTFSIDQPAANFTKVKEVPRRIKTRTAYLAATPAITLAAWLLRRSARFLWTTPRFAALSSVDENALNSVRALALSPDNKASANFFCWRLMPVKTLLFCNLRCSVCLARLAADRIFAIVSGSERAKKVPLQLVKSNAEQQKTVTENSKCGARVLFSKYR